MECGLPSTSCLEVRVDGEVEPLALQDRSPPEGHPGEGNKL
jgi:hypothetical protein